MFGWLRQRAENKIIQSHSSDMMPWLRRLCSLADEDIAAIYLSALAYRNILKRNTGIDLHDPDDALEKQKMLAVHIGGEIRDAQNSSLFNSANGLKVWLFTLRCVTHEQLRPVGLAIWTEMRRGFPFVHDIARGIRDQSGLHSDLTDLGQIPKGFRTELTDEPATAPDASIMTPSPIEQNDIRVWALGLASFPGGFGSGRTSEELNSTGGLYGHLPIPQNELLMMLSAIGVTTGAPGSAWDRIPEFSKFLINVDTWRFLISPSQLIWATRIGFVFGEGREALWVDSVKWFSTSDLPSIFQSIELATKRGKPLPSLDEKLRRMVAS